MALPNTNINTSLVGQALGSGSRDVGTLCTHPNINKWSRRKPVRDPRPVVPFEQVGKGSPIGEVYGENGLVLHKWTGDDTKITTYLRPGTWVDKLGQHSTPFRLGDFREYEHNIRVLPITVGPAPDQIYRKQVAIYANYVLPIWEPYVLNITDFSDLRIGVVIYGSNYETGEKVLVGAASAINQFETNPYSNGPIVNLTDVNWLYLDIKFCLMEGYHPWSDTIPDTAMYEIFRDESTQNKNWYNVPLVAEPEDVRTFEIVGFVSLQRIEYIIEAYTTTTGRIDIKDLNGTLITQITNISLPANTRVSGNATNIPLQSGVSYIAELYLADATQPVATRPMMVN